MTMNPTEQLGELLANLKSEGLTMTQKGFELSCKMLTQTTTIEIVECLKINEEQIGSFLIEVK